MAAENILASFALIVVLVGGAIGAQSGRATSHVVASGQQAEPDWLSSAKQAEGAGNFSQAAECYINYLKSHPQDAEIHQRLGLVYYLSNRFGDAVPVFQRALKLDPKGWASSLFLGICQYRLGQFAKALPLLRAAVQMKADLPEAHFWTGLTLVALGRDEEAIQQLQQVSPGSPLSLEADSSLVRAYRQGAENYYRRIEKVNPDSYRAHQLQAESLVWKDRNLEAIEEYRKALAREPRLEGIHRAIGEIYRQGGEFELARKEYESEIGVNPLDDVAHLRLGQYWLAKGEVNRAAAHLDLAGRINKDSFEAHRDLGQVGLARGDSAYAEPLLKTAVQQNPDDPLIHRILAELYRRTNRPDLARQELDLFRKLSSASGAGTEAADDGAGKSDQPSDH